MNKPELKLATPIRSEKRMDKIVRDIITDRRLRKRGGLLHNLSDADAATKLLNIFRKGLEIGNLAQDDSDEAPNEEEARAMCAALMRFLERAHAH